MAAVSLRPSAQRDSYSAFQPFSATGTVASAFTQRSADGRQLCRRGEKAARYGQILDHVTSSCWFGLEYHQIRVQRSNHAEDAPGISQVTASISTYQADKENAHASKAAETHRHVSKVIQECNWLQGLEGGLDTSHAPILHRLLKDDVGRDGIKPSNPYVRAGAPRLVVDIIDYGYQYTGIRRLGMPKCTRAPTITFCRQIRAGRTRSVTGAMQATPGFRSMTRRRWSIIRCIPANRRRSATRTVSSARSATAASMLTRRRSVQRPTVTTPT